MISEEDLAYLELWSKDGKTPYDRQFTRLIAEVRRLKRENSELSDEAEALGRVMEKQQQEHLAEAQESIEECDLLRASLAKLQDAINRYCETRNSFDPAATHHPDYYGAVDELYRLSRESGFRPRVRAGTEVAR